MLKNTGTTVRREADPQLHSHSFSCRLYSLLLSPQPVISDHGLLTTVAYKLGRDEPACYALEVCECIIRENPSQFALVAGSNGEPSPTAPG